MKKQPASSHPPFSGAPKPFLFITAAITGAAVMVIEILGAKMLAPYVGTSHFVWTAQIAVTLVALATGYYVGGRLADASPRLGPLYGCIAAAGFYLLGAVFMTRPIAYACLKFNLAFGSLLTSAFLYFIPLALLAMVGPYLIRVLTNSVGGVGTNVGRLTALSTMGSFAGTVLIGYVLIPFLPNSATMAITAFVLVLLAATHAFLSRQASRSTRAGVFVIVAAAGTYSAAHPARWRAESAEELFRGNSNFGLLQVIQLKNDSRRLYLNDYLIQNIHDPITRKSTTMFTYMLHGLARAYAPKINRALCIGLGVGIVPMNFAGDGVAVDVVEINPAVVPIARRFFNFDPGRVNLRIGDGRRFIAMTKQRYDAVILDAFLGESSPSHLMTHEAFARMNAILQPGGVLVINCFGDFEPGRDFFVASLERTLRGVFREVRIHNERDGGNIFFVASQTALKLERPASFEYVHPYCRRQVENAFDRIVETVPEHGIVLTDDYNPVEYYDAANREQLRKNLAFSMRSM